MTCALNEAAAFKFLSGDRFLGKASCVRQAGLTGLKQGCLLSTLKKFAETSIMSDSHHRSSSKDRWANEYETCNDSPDIETPNVTQRKEEPGIKAILTQSLRNHERIDARLD